MSYIDKNLLPGERILFRTKKHWILFFVPVVLTALSIYLEPHISQNPILRQVALAPWIVTAIFWAYYGIEYHFSDYAVTDKRVMMREGFFTRHTNEMRLNTISQVNVDQSLIGQLLNYGTVSINAFGAFDYYPLISRPGMFQKWVNQQLDQIVK